MKWPIVKLGDVCTFTSGGTPSKDIVDFWRGEIPWISSADIVNDVIQKPRHYLSNSALNSSSTNLVPPGTLLAVTRTGVGKVAITDFDLCFSQDITALHLDANCYPKYIAYALKVLSSSLIAQARGATIKGITRTVLASLRIPLPPLAEQKRIAAILDKAEEIRRKREQVIEKLDQLAQSIFLEMFGDFNKSIKFPLIDFGDIITETKLGLVRAATELDETNPLPYLRMNAIGRDGELTLDKLQYANASEEELASYKLITGDFLFNTRNSRELVGKTAVFNMQGLYLFNNNIMRIRFQPSAMPFYVQYVFKTTWFQEQLEKIKSGTTNVFAIYLKELKLLKFPLPKISEQQVFCRRIQKIETLKKIFRIALGSDVALHESLQHQAFTKGFNT